MAGKVPDIRFKGFSDAWEQRKLGDLIEVGSVKRIHQSDWQSEGIPFLRARDIVAKNQGRAVKEPIFISKETYDEYSKVSGKVAKGDLLVTGVGTIGEPYLISDEQTVYFKDGNVIWFKNSNVFNGQFLYTSFTHSKIQNFIKSVSGSGTVGTYTIQNGRKTPILYPTKEEQECIGVLAKQTQQLITLHQRKLSQLEKFKSSLLQNLFPKNGATNPSVRFGEFTNDWEQRKLGDEVQFLNGRAYKQSELLDKGKYKVLRVGNFNTNERWYYSDLELDKNKYVESGDLMYLWATNFGPELWTGPKTIYHYHIWKLKLNSDHVDRDFLYTWLLKDKEAIKQSTNGTTMVHVTKGNMEQRDFVWTDINEQQCIGQLFMKTDKLITLHQRKLDSLEKLKKLLLQKMFI